MAFADNGDIHLHESMFSGAYDLTVDHAEILARIHPQKRAVFDAVSSGELRTVEMVDDAGQVSDKRLGRSVSIHVNNPGGGMREIDYASIAKKTPKDMLREFTMRGFDAEAEPVIRLMKDLSLRLVFCTMPPQDHALGFAFNMDHFGAELEKAIGSKIEWDDRDVFLIKQSEPTDVRQITNFLAAYGKRGA